MATARARARGRAHLHAAYGIDQRRFAAADRRWWRRFAAGEATMEELRTGRLLDVDVPADRAEEIELAYREAQRGVRLRAGATRLVAALRASGRRVVILTNFEGGTDFQHRKIRSVGLDGAVDAVVVTGDIGFHKPHPAAFRAALDAVGAEAARSAMVGDNLVNDIEGALGAGFARAVWITRRRFRPADPRVRVARSVGEVAAALED